MTVNTYNLFFGFSFLFYSLSSARVNWCFHWYCINKTFQSNSCIRIGVTWIKQNEPIWSEEFLMNWILRHKRSTLAISFNFIFHLNFRKLYCRKSKCYYYTACNIIVKIHAKWMFGNGFAFNRHKHMVIMHGT